MDDTLTRSDWTPGDPLTPYRLGDENAPEEKQNSKVLQTLLFLFIMWKSGFGKIGDLDKVTCEMSSPQYSLMKAFFGTAALMKQPQPAISEGASNKSCRHARCSPMLVQHVPPSAKFKNVWLLSSVSR